MKKSGLEAAFFTDGGDSISRGGGFTNFSHTQNPIIEIYLGTLQPRDFPCLPSSFIATKYDINRYKETISLSFLF